MEKSVTISNEPIYLIRNLQPVSLDVFSRSLAEVFFNQKLTTEYFNSLTKKEAKNMLYYQLKWYGVFGEYHNVTVDESCDDGKIYEDLLNNAKEWVKKHYPYFTKKSN